MYGPPAVSYPHHRPAALAWLLSGICLAAALVLLFWLQALDQPGWRHALAFVSWAGALTLAWRGWQRCGSGRLNWDGQRWTLELDGHRREGCVSVQLDWQSGMLLAWQAPAADRAWLWVERTSEPLFWDDLRRAAHARRANAAVEVAP